MFADVTQALHCQDLPCLWEELLGKGWTVVAFQCAACLGSSLEIQLDQRASGDTFPRAAGLKRSRCSQCLISMWDIKPRLLLPGSAGFRSHGFCFWNASDKKQVAVSEKGLSCKELAALHPYWLQGAGGNLLSSLQSKAHQGILQRESACDS